MLVPGVEAAWLTFGGGSEIGTAFEIYFSREDTILNDVARRQIHPTPAAYLSC